MKTNIQKEKEGRAVVAESQGRADSATSISNSLRLIDVIDRLYEGKEVFFHYIQTVGDVSTEEVKFLTLDHKISDALAFLDQHRVRHIPILEEETQENAGGTSSPTRPTKRVLIGIISHRDLVRVLSSGVASLAQTEVDDKTLNQPLGTIITRNPLTVTSDTSLFEAIRMMLNEKISCLPVVVGPEKEQEVIGMLTSNDIIKCFLRMEVLRKAREAKPKAVRLIDFVRSQDTNLPAELLLDTMMGRVVDIMQDSVVTVSVEDSLEHAVDIMKKHLIRHLPVLDAQGRLTGILSDRNVLSYLPPIDKRVRKKVATSSTAHLCSALDELFQIDIDDAATKKALSTKVATAMTPNPVTVEPTTTLVKAAEIFYSQRFGAVPVVAADSTIKGIVTESDILRAVLALGRLLGCDRQTSTPP